MPSSSSSVGQFAAVHGVRQKQDFKLAAATATERVRTDDVPTEDKIWVELMANAIGRCGVGADQTAIVGSVRAVVEGEKQYIRLVYALPRLHTQFCRGDGALAKAHLRSAL